jgi:hypothetical protein
MNIAEASEILAGISYKPGWSFSWTVADRYEDTLMFNVSYLVPESDANNAPEYQEQTNPVMDFLLPVGDCGNDLDLYAKVFSAIAAVELHESREFFAVNGTEYRKLYHPHTTEGMLNFLYKRSVREVVDMPLNALVVDVRS